MPLANSNGPRWIRAQHVAAEKRREGLGPIRAFLARLFRGRAAAAPGGGKDTGTETRSG